MKRYSISMTSMPCFYISSAVKYVFKKEKKDDRSSNKVQSNNR